MSTDEFDFQALYDEFHAKIHSYLARLAGKDEADDLTQEVFVKISKALPAFKGESTLSTWIYRIATKTTN